MRSTLRHGAPIIAIGIGLLLCGGCLAQITGTVTSSVTGKTIGNVLVMGTGLNWTYSDSNGRYSLPHARFRGLDAPAQVPVSFRAEGYRPVTRTAETQDAVLDAALEDGAASEWKAPLCKDVQETRPLCNGSRLGA